MSSISGLNSEGSIQAQKNEREIKITSWLAVLSAIAALGALAAAGYFGGSAWHAGQNLLDSLPLKIMAPIALALTITSIGFTIRRHRLVNQNKVIYGNYEDLLNQADSNSALATQLSTDIAQLVAHLTTAKLESIRAISTLYNKEQLEQLVAELQKAEIASKCPSDKQARLKGNLDVIDAIFRKNSFFPPIALVNMIRKLEDALGKSKS